MDAAVDQAIVRNRLGLSVEVQVEAAHLLGQHKSWVCRRLALLEKLSGEVKEDMPLGLLGPSLARQLTRLPAGNQEAVLALTRRATLTAQEDARLHCQRSHVRISACCSIDRLGQTEELGTFTQKIRAHRQHNVNVLIRLLRGVQQQVHEPDRFLLARGTAPVEAEQFLDLRAVLRSLETGHEVAMVSVASVEVLRESDIFVNCALIDD